MSWGDQNWEDLNEEEGDYSLDANKMVNSLGHTLDDFATAAKSVNSDLTNAILAIKEKFDDAVDTFNTTYNVNLIPPGYVSPDLDYDLPELPDPPTLTPLVGPATAPTAPGTTDTILSTQAYTDAFALARDAALQAEQQALWDAGAGAAASGVGLPYAARQGAIKQIAQARAKLVNESALTQSALQAGHLREDRRWAYEQQLAYWVQTHTILLDWWTKYNTTRTAIWVEQSKGVREQFAAELAGIKMRLEAKDMEYKYWDASNKNELEKAQQMAADARAIQALIVATGEKVVYAYAGALAQQFQAWVSAVNYNMTASASPLNASYAE